MVRLTDGIGVRGNGIQVPSVPTGKLSGWRGAEWLRAHGRAGVAMASELATGAPTPGRQGCRDPGGGRSRADRNGMGAGGFQPVSHSPGYSKDAQIRKVTR